MSRKTDREKKTSGLRTVIGAGALIAIVVGGAFVYRATVERSHRSSLDAATLAVLRDLEAGLSFNYSASSHQTSAVGGDTSNEVDIAVEGETARAAAWGLCRQRSLGDRTPRDCGAD